MSRVKILLVAVIAFVWAVMPASAWSELRERIENRGEVNVSVDGAGMPDLPDGVPDVFGDPGRVGDALSRLATVPHRPDVDGYARAAFGKSWADVDRNGCDTRNDMLAASLEGPVWKPGSDCVVIAGMLHDPYTGSSIAFVKKEASKVQVDHLVPLSFAWDVGASRWPVTKRLRFANDPINLIVVSGKTNQAKGDLSPGEWMPVNRGFACTYVRRVALVAFRYELPLTADDVSSMAATADAVCGNAN